MPEFRWRWLPAVAAVAGIALALALARWQLGRAHEKEAMAARLEARAAEPAVTLGAVELKAGDLEWRRVTARGQFAPRYGILLDNRLNRGVPGYQVVMPLALDDGARYVLVNRGWVRADPDHSKLPGIRTPDGRVAVTGVAVVPSRRFFELSGRVIDGRVWQNLTLERYRKAFPIPLQPVVIQQESAVDDGLVREWSPPNLGVERHYGYAFQWLALAVTIAVLYLVTHIRRRSR